MGGRLAALASEGRITSRDVDVIMVATGSLTYEAVDAYLADRDGGGGRDGLPVADATARVVERICGCQWHDGGATGLVGVDGDDVHLRVEGACVHCPQIPYTMGVVERAIRFLAPRTGRVTIDGTRLWERREKPVGSQLTMGMLMRETGMRFDDLDDLLAARGVVTDADLERLAARCELRRSLGLDADDRGP